MFNSNQYLLQVAFWESVANRRLLSTSKNVQLKFYCLFFFGMETVICMANCMLFALESPV